MTDQPQMRRKWRRWVVAAVIAILTTTATACAFVFAMAVVVHWPVGDANLKYSIEKGLFSGVTGAIPILILVLFSRGRIRPRTQLLLGSAWVALTGATFFGHVLIASQ